MCDGEYIFDRAAHFIMSSAIVNSITVHGSKVFVASPTNSFHCLNANDGSMIWSTSLGPSVYLTSAQYCSSSNVVYSIQVN
jgi:outer membrane protein assembly factor BamB